MNSTGDEYSDFDGPDLISRKVSELVVMGGGYPSGYEYNFRGGNSSLAVHVVNNWPGQIVFSGTELGAKVTSGGRLMKKGPMSDPVKAAYVYYTYYTARYSWDPLTVMYALNGLGDLFEFGNEYGYNHVSPNGSNEWIFDEKRVDQHWLRLKISNAAASAELDKLLLEAALSVTIDSSDQHVEL
jgi:hypothetical protein